MDVPRAVNIEADHSIPPVVPETGPSPLQDMSNVAPALDLAQDNWEASQDDVYTQRQQVRDPPMMNQNVHSSPVSVPNIMTSDKSVANSARSSPKGKRPCGG